MLESLASSRVSTKSGWNGNGWGPVTKEAWNKKHEYMQFRMQGFLNYFMFQDTKHEKYVNAQLIDHCQWNRQAHPEIAEVCGQGGNCDSFARVFHHSTCYADTIKHTTHGGIKKYNY